MSKLLKKKILVVDDNPGVLFAIKAALESEGYDVRATKSFEGIASLKNNLPDLIILDVFLEDQDGRDVARELKAHKWSACIPIVLLSAYPGIDKLATEAGADDFLAKPFELDTLLALVSKYT